jgi:predicted RecB family nuclease
MKKAPTGLRLSASDLSNHLACRHSTELDLRVASGERSAPTWNSPDTQILRDLGIAHENDYVQSLVLQGLQVLLLRGLENDAEAMAATLAAMQRGIDVIVQAALGDGRWFGRADVLRRIDLPSRFGPWSYEVYDCKLARETKGTTVLQLSLYAHLVEQLQGVLPEFMYVVAPGQNFEPEQFRVLDYAAYYRLIKSRLEETVRAGDTTPATYPEPTAHCEVCRWNLECDQQRRRDDHLSLAAGVSRLQRKQFTLWNIRTVAELAVLPVPIEQRPKHGSRESYFRAREQARIQVAGRTTDRPVYEVLSLSERHGLSLLPEPSSGDIFFDLEGDPFTGLKGIEYLFGAALESKSEPIYVSRWAHTPAEENQAFEWFVDLVMDRWSQNPNMHVYHFAPYEPSAMKRLMGRYGTREDEIDRMLRGRVFVDLHTVLRRSVRASVEHYSLKALEAFHQFERKTSLSNAAQAMRIFRHGLEANRLSEISDETRDTVLVYNTDDCLSTRSLRNWLEGERLKLLGAGQQVPRPIASDPVPSEAISERQQRIEALVQSLTIGIPEDPSERSREEDAKWLLAALLDWHRRESKADWWEFFRLRELTDEELLDEKSAISGLTFLQTIDTIRGIPRDRYSYEKQETGVRSGDSVRQGELKIGEVISIDTSSRIVDIKKTKKTGSIHPTAVFTDKTGPNSQILADALFRLGSWIASSGIESTGPYRAARDLLLRHPPRLANDASLLPHASETAGDAANRLASLLDNTVLAIQGPPGTGKTFTAARMICELVRKNKKVGITATSHKVIRKLLDEVMLAAAECDLQNLRVILKVKEVPNETPPGITFTTDNADPLAALAKGTPIAAGTAWMWSREEYFEAVDVLFVDEAGQMCLADVLAIAQAAKSIVLLGDPQQLDQPSQGSHPDGANVSALEHLLGGAKTIPPGRGLFLDKTWRMHPDICRFTSEVFYDNRLHSRDCLERQIVSGHPTLSGGRLWFAPVMHEGNQNASPEEIECIATIINSLLQPGIEWSDSDGGTRPLRLDDILIVAPYNAQVADLILKIPGARIGTVDKFQGQQAPVVIYSLTTSSPEDAPHGMEFLYSLNRLNVATSRAQGMVIVVGSPLLLRPECRTPRQIQLANALSRYIELAREIPCSS